MPFRPESDEEFARYIMEYFLRNPKTSDTVEGVARWRLLDLAVHYAVEDTRRSLEMLVKKGYIKQTPVTGSSDHFSLNERLRSAAETFVASGKRRRDKNGGLES